MYVLSLHSFTIKDAKLDKKEAKFSLFQDIGHAYSSVPCFDFTQTPTASLFTFDLFVLTILTI
jgi:hypothetical protein